MASLIGALLPEERGLEVESLRFEPPHSAVLRSVGWNVSVVDTVSQSGMDAFLPDAAGGGSALPGRPYFTSRPDPIASPQREYTYRPTSPLTLSDFTMTGAPPGLSVDAATGVVSGRPTEIGVHDVTLSAAGGAGLRVEQQFQLYVDDRNLPLGADSHGRNFLRRLAQAMRYVLLPGAIAALVSVGGGLLFGAYAGYFGGPTDAALNLANVVMRGIPALLAVMFASRMFRDLNIGVTMIVVGLTLLPETADGIRARVRAFREKDFIDASRELGMSDSHILWNEIVWYNCRIFLLTRTVQAFIYALLVDVTVSYVGLLELNGARIGSLLLDARTGSVLERAPLLFMAPLLLLLAVISTKQLIERSMIAYWSRRA